MIDLPAYQGLLKVVLSRDKIPLNLPLQRETFKSPLWKRGEGGIFRQTGPVKAIHKGKTDFDVAESGISASFNFQPNFVKQGTLHRSSVSRDYWTMARLSVRDK